MRHRVTRGILFTLIFVLPLLNITGFLQSASASSVTPKYYSGNEKDLPREIRNLPSIKFDPARNGTKWLGNIRVTAEFSKNKKEVSFISNSAIAYVFVKAGHKDLVLL